MTIFGTQSRADDLVEESEQSHMNYFQVLVKNL